jgi:hypothetical protein
VHSHAPKAHLVSHAISKPDHGNHGNHRGNQHAAQHAARQTAQHAPAPRTASSPAQLLLAAAPTTSDSPKHSHAKPSTSPKALARADRQAAKAAQRGADKATKAAEKHVDRVIKQAEHAAKKAAHRAAKTVHQVTTPTTDPGRKPTPHRPPAAGHRTGPSHGSTPVGTTVGIGGAAQIADPVGSGPGGTSPGNNGAPPNRPAQRPSGGTKHHRPGGANRHPSSAPSRTPSTTHVLARNDVPLESTGAMVLLGGLAIVVLLVMSYAYWSGRRAPGSV